MGQARDEAGNIWETDAQGNAVRLVSHQGSPLASPKLPGELTQQTLDIRGKQADLAKSPYQLRTEAAQAAKAELDLKTAQEQYASQHPNVSTNGLYGDAYLKTLPDSEQNIIKALSEGRLAFPSGAGMRSPAWMQKLQEVAQYDPTFDATNFNSRAQGRINAIKGKLGQSNNALNTAIGHLGQLSDQISGTSSMGGFPLATTVNSIVNRYEKGAGDPGVTNFQDTAAKLADELEAVYRNGGGAEQGVTRQLRSLDADMSLKQKQGIVQNAMDLLASKMAANLSQYNFGTNGKPSWEMLDPHALQVLHDKAPGLLTKYFAPPDNGSGGGQAPPPGGPPPVAPMGGGGVPHADYSAMVGGPEQSVVTPDPTKGVLGQTYKTVYDPVMSGAIGALIRKGAPYETASAFAQSHGFNPPDAQSYAAALGYQQNHPGAKPNVQADRSVPTTFGERAAGSPAAAFAMGATSAGSAGLDDLAGRAIVGPGWDANRQALAATHPGADLAGNVLGGAAAMIGGGSALGAGLRAGAKGGLGRDAMAWALRNRIKAGAIGDAAYGGLYGANESPDDPLTGAMFGAAGGAGGGFIGSGLAAGSGAALRGVANPAVNRLRQAGFPLTAGEVLGGGWKKAQDALTSIYGPGNMVARRYEDGREALNRAAFNQAGQTIGAPIDAVGQQGIQALDAAKSSAYSNALDPVSLDLNNPQAIGGIRGAIGAAKAIPNADQASEIAQGALSNYIGNAAPNGQMSGADFQQAYRGLSRVANKAGSRIYGHEIGNALGQGQDALVGALQAQNPGAYEAFLAANSANRHLSVLSDAVNAAKNQIGVGGEPLFTPAQLGNAATNNARTYSGKVAAASGRRPFNQLATDAQQVMSSKLPESGTFPRYLMASAISGTGGMFGGQVNGSQGATEGAIAPLALLTLLGTRRGQKLLTASLLSRTAADRTTGRMLMRNPQIGGDLMAAAGIPLLSGP